MKGKGVVRRVEGVPARESWGRRRTGARRRGANAHGSTRTAAPNGGTRCSSSSSPLFSSGRSTKQASWCLGREACSRRGWGLGAAREGVDAAREAKDSLVDVSAAEAIKKLAFLSQLTEAEKDEYVRTALEDLRARLKGWPPEPERLPSSERLDAISESMKDGSIVLRRSYPIGDFGETLLVLVEEVKAAEQDGSGSGGSRGYRIRFYANAESPMQLHWGVIGTNDKTQSQWLLPPDELRPYDTSCTEEACNTELGGAGALQMTMVEISSNNPVAGLTFVLKKNGGKRGGEEADLWVKANDGGNFFVPLPTDWVKAAVSEKKAALRAGYLLEKIAQGTEGVVMYHHTYTIPGGTMIAMVKAVNASYQIEIVVDTVEDQSITLHWGMSTGNFDLNPEAEILAEDVKTDQMVNASGEWVLPPELSRPTNTECEDEENICSTELEHEGDHNVKRAIINAKPIAGVTGISFVLKIGEDYVRNDEGEDFHIPVPAGILQELSHEATNSQEVLLQRVFALGRDGSHGRVLALVSTQANSETMVEFFSDSPEPLVLHWGVSRAQMGEWMLPDVSIMHEPADSEIIAGKACETKFNMAPGQLLNDLLSSPEDADPSSFQEGQEGAGVAFAYLQRACLRFKADSDVIALPFVVRTDFSGTKQIWFKDYWGNYLLPLENAEGPRPVKEVAGKSDGSPATGVPGESR
ncbi:hypothetical protein HOP50_04g30540 [Chloropicon primus]|uniref:Alpha-glucan water dikinase-like N-terminal Ig-like domain-containing protein n=1 Tax=Chloropicon primus TaxID=1764295 RepID=A0A5B8MJ86_9CHLO|nr:hypothetical protein A3770_04p30510 [Chloropicon primus]UPQ99745.1 hypothetical protein HOP50_04g30540 [Chloropicon primus]|eukprot:QDZ20533.1 hypothetical protein A3770_04p30510 [Chloropicon primus]